MRVLGVPLPFYKSPTLLLGWGVSPFVFWQLLKARPDVIHAAFPGALRTAPPLKRAHGVTSQSRDAEEIALDSHCSMYCLTSVRC